MERSRRADLILFVLYCAFYLGFMAIAAFRQDLMAMPVVGGVNLAVAYGMGLIVGAIGFAVVSSLLHMADGRGKDANR